MTNLTTNIAEYAIILNDKNEFLLVQWGEKFGFTWHFPGGRLDSGEREIAGLVREVHEELNTQIIVDKPIFTKNILESDIIGVKPKVPARYAIFYLAKLADNSQLKIDNVEHVAYKWFSRGDLPTIKFWLPFYREMLEKVLPK